MADAISPALVSPNLTQPIVQTTAADLAKRAKIKDAAQSFESQFISQMLGQMFSGVSTDGPFGGGFGEEMFRSVMMDAIAKKMTQAGGIGLADTVQREMLKMQGMS
jgi:Rod binding domain-containing protein